MNQPWPWYVAGPLIGLIVPALLIAGNRSFGISSSLRHICAACFPASISFFKYNWKRESWNLFFAAGILLGGVFVALTSQAGAGSLNPALVVELKKYGISDYSGLLPSDLFSWEQLISLRGFILIVVGGFLVGFGTRYAGGCTSGHTIMGLSTLQWPSLVATICFMVGGFVMANFILPIILAS